MATPQPNDDEYEMSERSEQLFQMYWPEHLTEDHPMFQVRMFELQAKLIEGHLMLMSPSGRARATKTLSYIKQQMRDSRWTKNQ